MSLEGLLLALIITAALVVWIVRPLLKAETAQSIVTNASIHQHERLSLYYERVLRNIHDLDEDFATGKLNAEEYQTDRETWVQRGTAVLRALDELDSTPLTSDLSDDAALDAEIEAKIEARVRSYRAEQTS